MYGGKRNAKQKSRKVIYLSHDSGPGEHPLSGNNAGTADKNDVKQPIKWRVLSVEGDDTFLVADRNLDVQRYDDTDTGRFVLCSSKSNGNLCSF